MPKTIIFIHGAWVAPNSWELFMPFFESRGYSVLAPSWPGKEKSVEEQKANPDPVLEHLGIKEIVDHYADIIQKQSEPPILIGHSFGGLFVQMLLDRGLGSAGIAIDPAPPKGVLVYEPSAFWSLRLPLFTPFGWRKILRWPFNHFRYSFVDVLPPGQQRAAYDNYVVPESGRIFWQAALAPFNNVLKVNYKNSKRAPLLIIAGEKDKIVPASINRRNFKKYLNSGARTDFKEFPGRVHWIIAQQGWEEVAAFCEDWLQKVNNK